MRSFCDPSYVAHKRFSREAVHHFMNKSEGPSGQPEDTAAIRHIQAGVGAPVEVEFLAHAVWNGGAAFVAERFSDRRIYLAGDATHLFSPTGGFGMNTGIDGAANLAWKLAATV